MFYAIATRINYSLSLLMGDIEVKPLFFALMGGDLVGLMSLSFSELVGVDNALLLFVSHFCPTCNFKWVLFVKVCNWLTPTLDWVQLKSWTFLSSSVSIGWFYLVFVCCGIVTSPLHFLPQLTYEYAEMLHQDLEVMFCWVLYDQPFSRVELNINYNIFVPLAADIDRLFVWHLNCLIVIDVLSSKSLEELEESQGSNWKYSVSQDL